jgi:hypothetical protein
MASWKEFNPYAKKSMKDDFSQEELPFTSEIIAYLNRGEVVLVSPSCSVDVLSGEIINPTKCVLTDGVFSWSDSLEYYVQKYYLRLPSEFLEKILGEQASGCDSKGHGGSS